MAPCDLFTWLMLELDKKVLKMLEMMPSSFSPISLVVSLLTREKSHVCVCCFLHYKMIHTRVYRIKTYIRAKRAEFPFWSLQTISLYVSSLIFNIFSNFQNLKKKGQVMCCSQNCRLQSGMARFGMCQIAKLNLKSTQFCIEFVLKKPKIQSK
jgi:hypothetical protein